MEMIQNLLSEADRDEGAIVEEKNMSDWNECMSVLVIDLCLLWPQLLVLRSPRCDERMERLVDGRVKGCLRESLPSDDLHLIRD